jgi:hypothetical protein
MTGALPIILVMLGLACAIGVVVVAAMDARGGR